MIVGSGFTAMIQSLFIISSGYVQGRAFAVSRAPGPPGRAWRDADETLNPEKSRAGKKSSEVHGLSR